MWLWASHLNFQSLSFLIYEMRVVNTFLVGYLWRLDMIMALKHTGPNWCSDNDFHFLSFLWQYRGGGLLLLMLTWVSQRKWDLVEWNLVSSAFYCIFPLSLSFFLLMVRWWYSPHGRADSFSVFLFPSQEESLQYSPLVKKRFPVIPKRFLVILVIPKRFRITLTLSPNYQLCLSRLGEFPSFHVITLCHHGLLSVYEFFKVWMSLFVLYLS